MRNKDSSNEEQKRFNWIDKATHNTISATFNKSVFDTGSQSFIDWSIKLSLQNAFKCLTPNHQLRLQIHNTSKN